MTQDVIAAVIKREQRFLLCQRPAHKRHGLMWEFPGGKLEAGEDLLQAASREMMEELALRVLELGPLIMSVNDENSPFVIHFVAVSCEGDPIAHEHHDIRWVSASEMLTLELAPADRKFAEFFAAKKTAP